MSFLELKSYRCHCLLLLPLFVGFSVRSVFCFTVFCVFSGVEIISLPLFAAAPIVCGGSVLGPCFVLKYFVYFLVFQSICCVRERERERERERAVCFTFVLF